jgi:hypothetical protein
LGFFQGPAIIEKFNLNARACDRHPFFAEPTPCLASAIRQHIDFSLPLTSLIMEAVVQP